MSNTVRVFVLGEGGVYVPTRKPKGHRKEEWNRQNRKIGRGIRRRQSAYDALMASPKFTGNKAGYHRPGSAS